MFRLLRGCGYRCLCVQPQLASWRQNATILQKQSLIIWLCCSSEETWLLLFCRAEAALTPSRVHMHVKTVCVHAICTHTYGCKHAGYTDEHTHTVCSYYYMKGGKEASVPRHVLWNMSDMALCLQARLVTLLNCCNFLHLDWPAVA